MKKHIPPENISRKSSSYPAMAYFAEKFQDSPAEGMQRFRKRGKSGTLLRTPGDRKPVFPPSLFHSEPPENRPYRTAAGTQAPPAKFTLINEVLTRCGLKA